MKIAHLTLKTQALDTLREFYVDHLGLHLLEETDGSFTLDAGESRLMFVADDEEDAYRYHFAFNIPYNQMMDAELWLAQRVNLIIPEGATDAWVEHTDWQAEALYFADPAGNIVEFIGRQRLAEDTAIPFSAQSIQNISEIGLVVTNVEKDIHQLRAAGLSVPDFRAGSPDFRPLGDDDGLFIVVQAGRPWFPTPDVPAEVYPIALSIWGDVAQTIQLKPYPYQIQVMTT
jgi:catechol 2,3-dioxygenase-like lactoylglutathione lyase family enzyme